VIQLRGQRPVKGRWAPRLRCFAVWPSFTFTYYTVIQLYTGSTACEREMSTPPTLLRSMAFLYLYLSLLHCVSQKMSQVWLGVTLTHIHQFKKNFAHVISRHSKSGHRYNLLNYLDFTYFILLWSETTEMTRCRRHCYSVPRMYKFKSVQRPRQRCVKMVLVLTIKL